MNSRSFLFGTALVFLCNIVLLAGCSSAPKPNTAEARTEDVSATTAPTAARTVIEGRVLGNMAGVEGVKVLVEGRPDSATWTLYDGSFSLVVPQEAIQNYTVNLFAIPPDQELFRPTKIPFKVTVGEISSGRTLRLLVSEPESVDADGKDSDKHYVPIVR